MPSKSNRFIIRIVFISFRPSINLSHSTTYATLSNSLPYHSSNINHEESHLLDFLSRGSFHHARQLLDEMPQRKTHSSVVTWTSLISKFSKQGFVDEARAVFDIIPKRNVVTYNAMLSGYVQCGRLNEAYGFFQMMPERNVVSWTSMLYGFMNCGRVEEGKRLFRDMPERNVVSWNCMVGGLVKNGDLEAARDCFDVMPIRDFVSWNSMIDGYVEEGMMEEARKLFDLMEEKNVVTWTSLIAGYCRVGDVGNGYNMFREMPVKNVVSWTAMIGGFTWNGYFQQAISVFLEMKKVGNVEPNDETLVSLAYACAGIGFHCVGMQIHAQMITNGWMHQHCDERLWNSLVYMYSRFGLMKYAETVFMSNSRSWTTKSCNALIDGYVQIGQLERAQYIFDIIPVRDKVSWTSLMSGYLHAGKVAYARILFGSMPERDGIAWTAMISGYLQNELFGEAMYLFREMLMQGVVPLQSTYSALLGAAGATANLDQGKKLHCWLIKTQTNIDLIVENSLISMYAKCGQVGSAHDIFLTMALRDLISWNAMIMGYSHHGLAHEALSLFGTMTNEYGIKPNSVTFLGILSACSHAGLINEGWEIYRTMSGTYGIQPDAEHYICMINLLGRAGKVAEAEEFALSLPCEQEIAVWGALLGVCGLSDGNFEIARRTSHKLLELDYVNTPALIVLSNMHAASGNHKECGQLREEMALKGMRKLPGGSWISRGLKFCVFLSGDSTQS